MADRGLEIRAALRGALRWVQSDRLGPQLVAGDRDEVGLDGRRDGHVALSPSLHEAGREVVDAGNRDADEVEPFSDPVLDGRAGALVDAGEDAVELLQLMRVCQRFGMELLGAAGCESAMAGCMAGAKDPA